MRNSPEPGKFDKWDWIIDEGLKGSGTYTVDIGATGRGVNQLQADGTTKAQVYYQVYAYNSAGSDAEGTGFYNHKDLADPAINFTPESSSGSLPFLDDVWRAQTFNTTGAINATIVNIRTSSSASTDVTATVEIWGVDGSNKPDYTNQLGEATTNKFDGWKTVVYFDSPVTLNASTMYALVVHSDSHSIWREWQYKSGNEYTDGAAWRSNTYDGSTWYQPGGEEGYDLQFKIYDRGPWSGEEYCGVATSSTSPIEETTATLRGYLDYIGSENESDMEQQNATVHFEYGLTDAYGTNTTLEDISPTVPYAYTKAISGLTAGTTYHYRFVAENNMGIVYCADQVFTTRDISEEGDMVAVGESMSFPHQRNSFYVEGRYWLFYVDDSADVVFVSSEDGSTWSSTTLVIEDVVESSFALTFDREYVHVIWARRAEPLYYRMGKPNNDGTITWQAEEQEALPINGNPEDESLWTTPSIATDVNGYPWVISGICENPNSGKIVVSASTTKDGTWTTKSGFPTDAGSIFGSYYQRGSLVALNNGNMYAVAGKRANNDFWSCNKWCGYGGEYLKGCLWNSSNSTWGGVETITTTRMAWIGDAAMDMYLLWSVVTYQNDVYLVFTNQVMPTAPDSTHNIQFLQRVDGAGWTSEVTIQAGVLERTAPILAIDDSGFLYCFWGNSPDLHKIYYKKRVVGTWDTDPTAWKFENSLEGSGVGGAGLYSIQSWEYATEGLVALHYYASGGIKIAYMGTGFAVSTRATDDIGAFTATLNGYLVDDGGETCSVRFQYGETISYGHNTNWQSGFTTDEEFDAGIYNLASNTTYHVRAQAKHSDGFIVSGADRTFTTRLYDDTITGFKGIPYSTSIGLSWDTGAPEYLVRFALDGYPTSTTNGSLAYSGNSTSATHTGLAPGTTYYYSLWGKSGDSYSGNYATLMLTTSAYIDPGDTLTPPTEPSNWMAAPDYERLEGLGYFYDGVNGSADALEMPRATLWFILYIGLAVFLALLFYLKIRQSKGAGTLAIVVLTILLFAGSIIGLLPYWIPLIGVVTLIGLAISHKEVARG